MAVTLRCFSLALSNSFRKFSASFLNLSSLNTKNTRGKKTDLSSNSEAAGDNQAQLDDTRLQLITNV